MFLAPSFVRLIKHIFLIKSIWYFLWVDMHLVDNWTYNWNPSFLTKLARPVNDSGIFSRNSSRRKIIIYLVYRLWTNLRIKSIWEKSVGKNCQLGKTSFVPNYNFLCKRTWPTTKDSTMKTKLIIRRAKYTLKALPSDLSNQSKECRMKN